MDHPQLIDSYTEGFIEKQEFEPRISHLRQRLSALEDQAQQIKNELAQQAELHLVITRLEDFAAQVKDGLVEADWLTKRELIRTLVKRIEIGKEQVNIVFRVTPDPFNSGPDRGNLQHCWRGMCTAPHLFQPPGGWAIVHFFILSHHLPTTKWPTRHVQQVGHHCRDRYIVL